MDTANNIRMHDHLRDLGRNLAKSPELPRRIWRTEDFIDLLQQSCDTDVRGISICAKKIEEQSFSRCKIKNLQLLDIKNSRYCRHNCCFGWFLADFHRLSVRASGMHHPLERIQYALQSPNLIWFSCDLDCDSSLLSWIPTKKLRVLELKGRNLKILWQESQAPLQLRQLTVRDQGITSLQQSLENLTNLEHIEISCFHLRSLPDLLGTLTRLRYLKLWSSSGTSIEVLPSQLARQRSLEVLDLRGLDKLAELPSDIGELKNLKSLSLDRCLRLESLPDSLGQLNQLTELTLYKLGLREVSFKMVEGERESICPNLQHLHIYRCADLAEVGTLPDALTTLELTHCDQLRKIEWASPLSKLRVLSLEGCTRLEQLPSLETLVSLEELDTSYCEKLRSIRGLAHLPKLRTIRVRGCTDLEELEGVEDFTWT